MFYLYQILIVRYQYDQYRDTNHVSPRWGANAPAIISVPIISTILPWDRRLKGYEQEVEYPAENDNVVDTTHVGDPTDSVSDS